ncbi:MAG: poly-gamma-glutamate synthase PgsB [Gammaproteobacteria bacterium]
MIPIIIITGLILIYLVIEAISHRYYLSKIPIRIHVNGTRGKSSVTRLIAAGLRQGGMVTCGKTTGTLPRFICPDGTERSIYRPSRPNILEQISTIKTAARYAPKVIVIECMAVQPLLQSLCELKLIRSTHGVITNVRADHLDVMGPDESDVALALAGTVPVGGRLYTTEKKHLNILKKVVSDRNSILVSVENNVHDDMLSKFCYTEHKENIAVALQVCEDLGVSREIALTGMWEAPPDAGALTQHVIGSSLFFNAFAANDPVSTGQLWHELIQRNPIYTRRIALINCRHDRKQRSQQFAQTCQQWEPADQYIVIGTGTSAFIRTAEASGIDRRFIVDASDWDIENIMTTLINTGPSLIVGMGNIMGAGFELLAYIKNIDCEAEKEKYD